MSRIGIIYFSGTGNTEFVARNMKEHLESNNKVVDLINIEKDKPNLELYENIIVGGPVYVERYPEILLTYIDRELREYKGKVMLYSTQAAESETSVFKHGSSSLPFLNITYSEYIVMPNNLYNMMFPKTPIDVQNKLFKEAVDKGNEAVDSFLEGKCKEHLVGNGKVKFINWVYKIFYKYFAIRYMNKVTVNKDLCTDCKICERNCPTQSITLIDKEVKVKESCTLCQRCISRCPQNAFKYKGKVVDQYKL